MWIIILCLISIILPLSAAAQDTLSTKPSKPYHRIYLPPPGESQVLRQWLIQQAQDNDAQAQHELCLRYLQGLGFPPDTALAVFWLQKAVKAKLPSAIYNHGIFANNGIGLEWNPFEAYRNFQTAAQMGMPEAQYVMGILYTDNLVVRQNIDQAAIYLKQAFDQGYIPAGKVLNEMKQRGLIQSDSAESMTDPDSILMDPGREWTSSSVLMDPNLSADLVDFNRDPLSDSQRDSLVIQLLNRKTDELQSLLGIAD
ncbi:MAG: sel1 repeat family protein, partial [Candidatus Delongbacteria bacterium]|nr:sel1 repeat family protein [Candidatus Delongbacteria bacterium]